MAYRITSPFGTLSVSPYEHDSVLEQLFESSRNTQRETEPTALPLDIYEDDHSFIVSADLPGFDRPGVPPTSGCRLNCS